MLKDCVTPRRKKVAYLVMASLAALACLIAGGSAEYSECYSGGGKYSEQYPEKEPASVSDALGRRWRCEWVAINENEGIVVGSFTAALFFATVLLWLSTNNVIRSAEKSSERQLRAYVVPTGISLICDGREIGGQSHWIPRLHWKNAGQTPTRNLVMYTQIALGPHGQPPDFPLTFDQPVHRLLGPNIETSQGDAAFSFSLIQRVWNLELALYITGIARYTDVFGGERVTLACYQFDISPQEHLGSGMVAGAIAVCAPLVHSDWNAADEECERYRDLLARIPESTQLG